MMLLLRSLVSIHDEIMNNSSSCGGQDSRYDCNDKHGHSGGADSHESDNEVQKPSGKKYSKTKKCQ